MTINHTVTRWIVYGGLLLIGACLAFFDVLFIGDNQAPPVISSSLSCGYQAEILIEEGLLQEDTIDHLEETPPASNTRELVPGVPMPTHYVPDPETKRMLRALAQYSKKYDLVRECSTTWETKANWMRVVGVLILLGVLLKLRGRSLMNLLVALFRGVIRVWRGFCFRILQGDKDRRLLKSKQLFDAGVLTEEEYEERLARIKTK